ncbi:LPS export ABC transporter periplasmic protein LptC [Cochlodiniinecator piscidefendens]|uniref:LPS export ABC transporter periplasmic protein LptC n=1 Tax=Cochlodiniinecator piscidefendens TaxID=2715756 RepID=UPI00140C1E6D|nr:LPS export ABC transporter periplasmic protein LptC [Cochlodiniinecator piscidefendens]
MASLNDTYSRFILWTKIALPLAGLLLLATLFLFSRGISPDQAIPFADVDLDALSREQRMSQPAYSGVTANGEMLSFTAQTVRPDSGNQGQFTAENLSMSIETPSGLSFTATAGKGGLDDATQVARLEDQVHLSTSSGFEIDTDAITTSIDGSLFITDGQIDAIGPFGTLTAGRAHIEALEETPNQYVLIFNEGVKLIYTPQN